MSSPLAPKSKFVHILSSCFLSAKDLLREVKVFKRESCLKSSFCIFQQRSGVHPWYVNKGR